MIYVQEIEEQEFTNSTDAEWDREDARLRGEAHRDRQWILSDRDVWHRNPSYTGPEQRHPEDSIE